jgi:hypothetical protein
LAAAAVLTIFTVTGFAAAQGFDLYFGMGTARNGASNQFIDITGTGTGVPTPPMDGLFGTIGGGVMLTPSLGVGGEVMFRFAKGDYSGLEYRPIFYDFNGIWTPGIGVKWVRPEFQAGFGGVNMRFYGGGAYSCDYYTGRCTDFAGSSNHFQLHAGVGLRFYFTEHAFIRPTFDYRYVTNFTNEFNSNHVPAYTIAIGYSAR